MTKEKRKQLQELLESDTAIRREYLGLHTQLAPFPQHCSTQRLMMFSSHAQQSVVLDQCEPPRIFTGMENVIGKYEFSTTRREQDIHVLAIIPKFRPTSWTAATIDMPTHTVIYRGLNDNKINYMNVNRYTFLHDGFGYINDCPASEMLSAENIIPKDACLQQSPAWRTGDYSYGLNGNVIFITDDAATEDAMVISESFAKKCTNLAVHRIKLNMNADDVLLNLYGDEEIDEYKVIPNIGETVREDGVLAAIRAKNAASYVSDMTMEALRRIEPMHDELHKAPPGSKILDVDVYINFDYLKKLDPTDSVYEQLLKIYNDHQYYYDEVIRCYQEYVQQGLEISEDFNTLVLRCMELTCNRKYSKKNIKLCDPREPIEFITVQITYSYEREISLGSKLTGREGKLHSPAIERSLA